MSPAARSTVASVPVFCASVSTAAAESPSARVIGPSAGLPTVVIPTTFDESSGILPPYTAIPVSTETVNLEITPFASNCAILPLIVSQFGASPADAPARMTCAVPSSVTMSSAPEDTLNDEIVTVQPAPTYIFVSYPPTVTWGKVTATGFPASPCTSNAVEACNVIPDEDAMDPPGPRQSVPPSTTVAPVYVFVASRIQRPEPRLVTFRDDSSGAAKMPSCSVSFASTSVAPVALAARTTDEFTVKVPVPACSSTATFEDRFVIVIVRSVVSPAPVYTSTAPFPMRKSPHPCDPCVPRRPSVLQRKRWPAEALTSLTSPVMLFKPVISIEPLPYVEYSPGK